MTYKFTGPQVGMQPITETSAVQKHPIGTRVRALDDTYGEGEFAYMPGVANNAVGLVNVLDQYAKTTALTAAGSRGPVGIAMSANIANQYGWYQVKGSAVVKAAAVLAAGSPYVIATAGTIDDAGAAGDKIDGMRIKTADGTPAAGYAVCQIADPSANGNG